MLSRAAIKHSLAASKRGALGFFQVTRDFNQATLRNVQKYLEENKEKVRFEKNESGFIRTAFPNDVFQPDGRVMPLAEGERLRANFWFHTGEDISMGDESIHDHPSAFQSYIVSGGYEHELYRVSLADQVVFPSKGISLRLNPEEVWAMYQKFIAYIKEYKFEPQKFQFTIDKATKEITYKGMVNLRLSGVETTKAGDIIEIDSHMIHRVSKFHAVPGEKTLSLNIVRNEGKGKTNIFLPERKESAVKVEREEVSAEETALAVEEMTSLFSKASMS